MEETKNRLAEIVSRAISKEYLVRTTFLAALICMELYWVLMAIRGESEMDSQGWFMILIFALVFSLTAWSILQVMLWGLKSFLKSWPLLVDLEA